MVATIAASTLDIPVRRAFGASSYVAIRASAHVFIARVALQMMPLVTADAFGIPINWTLCACSCSTMNTVAGVGLTRAMPGQMMSRTAAGALVVAVVRALRANSWGVALALAHFDCTLGSLQMEAIMAARALASSLHRAFGANSCITI